MQYDKIGGRRFFLSFMSGAAACFLVYFGKVTPDAWSMVMIATVAAYITGASYEAGKNIANGNDPKTGT